MKLLGEDIEYDEDYHDIDDLKYFVDNPRVYSVAHSNPGFKSLPEEKQQEIVHEKLLKEPSVKNLLPEIKRHKGLIEPILVRWDTKEVIEGNSRLAAYRKLRDNSDNDDWDLIHCKIVGNLNEEHLVAFLSEIHLKGKTRWTSYEKYNFAYVRSQKGTSTQEIASLFGESAATIGHRIKVIKLMEENSDNVRNHLSYYDVLIRNKDAYREIRDDGLRRILREIKAIKDEPESEENSHRPFTAQELRKALPDILSKPKVLKQYEDEKIDFEEMSERAKISQAKTKIQRATSHLNDISRKEINALSSNDLNALGQAFKRLKREIDKIEKQIKEIKDSRSHGST